MADLDNFFAKKDRKKAKGKKFTTTEEIAKKLEETAKRLGKESKDKSTIQEIEEIQQIEVNICSFPRVIFLPRFPWISDFPTANCSRETTDYRVL